MSHVDQLYGHNVYAYVSVTSPFDLVFHMYLISLKNSIQTYVAHIQMLTAGNYIFGSIKLAL